MVDVKIKEATHVQARSGERMLIDVSSFFLLMASLSSMMAS